MAGNELVRLLAKEIRKEKSFLKSQIEPKIFKDFLGTFVKLNEERWKKLIKKAASEYGKVSEKYSEEELREALPEVFAQYAKDEYDRLFSSWSPETVKAVEESSPGGAHSKANELVGSMGAEKVRELEGEIGVLDVGMGSGNTSLAFLDKVREEVRNGNIEPSVMERIRIVGLEPSPALSKEAKEKLEAAGANIDVKNIHVEDIREHVPAGKFDIVLSSTALHHVPRLSKDAFGNIEYALKEGGHGIVSDICHPLHFPSKIRTAEDLVSTISYLRLLSKLWVRSIQAGFKGERRKWASVLEGHVPQEICEQSIRKQGLELKKSGTIPKTKGLERFFVFRKPERKLG